MSLAATRLLALRAKNAADKNEVRPDQFGAIDYFIAQSKSNPLVDAARKSAIFGSMGRSVQLPVLKYDGTVTVSTSRSCTIADKESASALVDVVFNTYQVGVTMIPTEYSNNEIGYAKDFEKKVLDAVRALKNKMDQDAIAALSTAKTQVVAEPLDYTFSSNVLGVPYEARQDILGDLDAIMAANGFTGRISVIGNYAIKALVAKLAELGPENSINKHLEFLGKAFYTSINVANESGVKGTFYAVEDGNVDLAYRVDREAFANGKAAGHEWFVSSLPGIDIPIGVHYYEEVGDKSDTTGEDDMTCVHAEKWGFSIDVAYIVAYNSVPTTKASPIIKAALATGTGFGSPVYVVNQSEA